MRDIAGIVSCAVAAVEPILRELEPGFYLHGTAASHSMTATSDIDVLILCGSEVTANQRADIDSKIADPRLDVKAFSCKEFATDPWVDLDAAMHVHGRDWRRDLPRPTVDQRAREAVLMVCIATEDRSPASSKYVGWLISALLAATHGQVPGSRHAALASLDSFEPKRAAALRALADDAAECDGVADLEAEVIAILQDQARTRTGPLGPACWRVIDRIVPPPDGAQTDD